MSAKTSLLLTISIDNDTGKIDYFVPDSVEDPSILYDLIDGAISYIDKLTNKKESYDADRQQKILCGTQLDDN